MSDNERLAVVTNVGYGMRDFTWHGNGKPGLFFDVNWPGGGSLLIFFGEQADEIIAATDCYSITKLEGRTCIVTVEDSRVSFARWWKP